MCNLQSVDRGRYWIRCESSCLLVTARRMSLLLLCCFWWWATRVQKWGGGQKKKNKGNRHVRRICSCHGVCMRMEEMTSVALLTTRCEGKANSCSSLKPLHNYRSSARKRCFSPLFFFSILFTKQPFNCLDLVEHPELRRATWQKKNEKIVRGVIPTRRKPLYTFFFFIQV